MTFRQIAFHNILRNKRIYVAHFLSGAFAVMIFFIYAMLLFHPDLQGELASTSETIGHLSTIGLKVSQYLIFIFSFLFLLYSVSSYLKTRKKEFGILMIHGMSPRQQNGLIFTENMMIGLASIIAGIASGLVFTKLTLLICAHILEIKKGLSFYFPDKAMWTTAGAFLLLFLLVSLVTTRLVRTGQLVDLIQSEEKPKDEPKASTGLSLLAILLIGIGYSLVFYFVIERIYSLLLLSLGILFTVAGTYFLFTQLSVFLIQAYKKQERLFYKKVNLITISELAYRVRDNASMFFMVSIVSAVAFTGIGVCLALGNPGLSQMTNPFAFTYVTQAGNSKENLNVAEIEKALKEGRFPYEKTLITPKYAEGVTLLKLSDYNQLAKALGYPLETLESDLMALGVPSTVQEKSDIANQKSMPQTKEVLLGENSDVLEMKKYVPHLVTPAILRGNLTVVTDSFYNRVPFDELGERRYYTFAMNNWEETKEISRQLVQSVGEDREEGKYFLVQPLVLEWLEAKQKNGILLIISVLVGVVFFTFAASFLYLRLYSDLERDQKQFQLMANLGLSRSELKTIVTRQFRVMFFIPLLTAILHSTVAFTALQQLVDFSIVKGAITIFAAFAIIQVMYYFTARWRYMEHLYQKLT